MPVISSALPFVDNSKHGFAERDRRMNFTNEKPISQAASFTHLDKCVLSSSLANWFFICKECDCAKNCFPPGVL